MKSLYLALAGLCLLATSPAHSQELSPRAFWPAPQGTRLVSVGLLHTSGDIVPDPSLPVKGVDSRIDTLFLGYLQTVSLWGRTANLVLELPYSKGETRAVQFSGPLLEREYQGMGDIAASISINLMGAPSMDMEAFTAFRREPHPLLGASLKLVAPTGRYDNERIVNVGANRWAAKVELGYIRPLSPKWLLEVELGSWFFGDNDDFLGMTREQSPIAALEGHLVRRIRPGMWASLDVNGYWGGRSRLDGRRLNDLQRDSKLGATLVLPVARGRSVKLSYNLGSVNDSDEDFYIFQLSYQHVF